MKNIKIKRLYYIAVSLLILVFDQISKYIININYKSIISQNLGFFTIDLVKNYGAAFNILTGNRILLSFISIFISIILIVLIVKNNRVSNIELYSYSFILGGTLGNGVERIFRGYVIDFINLNFINFPVFNIADISINIGFFLLLYYFIRYKK